MERALLWVLRSGKRPYLCAFGCGRHPISLPGEMRACGRRSQRLDALWLLWKISRRCGDAICRCPQAEPRNSKISSGTSSEGGIINAVLLAMEAGLRQHFHGGLRPGLQCAFRSRRPLYPQGKNRPSGVLFGWGHRRAHDGKRYDGNSGAFDHVLYLCTAEGRRKGQLFAIPPLTVRIGGRGFPEKEKDLEDNRFPNPFCYA